MRDFNGKNFNERLQDAKRARDALLKKASEAPGPNDPEVIRQREERRLKAVAKEAERVKRAEMKIIEERERAEREAAEAVRLKALAEEEAIKEGERQAALAAEQKAARDARYAARKKRKN